MLKGTLIRQYRTQGGKKMFVYAISGKADEVQAFEDLQDDYLVHADESDPKYTGKPLLFSSVQAVQNPGQTCDVQLNRNGDRYNVIEDTKFGMFKDALKEVIRETYGNAGVTTDAENDGDDEPAKAKPAATSKKKLADAKM